MPFIINNSNEVEAAIDLYICIYRMASIEMWPSIFHIKRKYSGAKVDMTSCEDPSSRKHALMMDVERVLHMKEGLGETSYAQNSSLQKMSMEAIKHIIVKSAAQAYASTTTAPNSRNFTIADLGCSSGINALHLVVEIIKSVASKARRSAQPVPEFSVFLNDLPTNDFNVLFLSFPELIKKLEEDIGGFNETSLPPPPVYLAGVPGSFYGRLFPSDSLDFIYSCYSLHWLSQVPQGLVDKSGKPMNEGKVYISDTSPPAVASAYLEQFKKDFRLFLRARSQELKVGGRMAIAMLGRTTPDHSDKSTTILWQVLNQSFSIMISQEMVDEEKVDTYNAPFYAPTVEEIEDEVKREGSFTIDYLKACELSTSSGDPVKDARITSMAIRAIQESMISHHFGGTIIDSLFQIYRELLGRLMVKEEIKSCHLLLVLRRLH